MLKSAFYWSNRVKPMSNKYIVLFNFQHIKAPVSSVTLLI